MAGEFVSDIMEIRRRVRAHMQEGPITAGDKADRQTVARLLNESLATELECVLRYKRHYYMASGIHAQAVTAEFAEHAAEEQAHADQIAERITQLGGAPDFNPDLVTRSHSEYIESDELLEMIKEDLVAERIAIGAYADIVRHLGNHDCTTRRMMEAILAKEEERADDLRHLIERLGGDAKGEDR